MLRILTPLATFTVLAIVAITAPAKAEGVRGCNETCMSKCRAYVPTTQFPTMQSCIDHWVPINLAAAAAKKAAHVQAEKERADWERANRQK
jgi:hypothetical protein